MRRHSRGAWPYSFPPNCAFELNRDSPQAEGLLAWWPTLGSRGANVLRDFGGRGNHGAFKGPGEPAWVTDGEFGAVLNFDGSDDYITATIPIFDPTQGFSLTAWVRCNSLTGADNKEVFAQQDGTGLGRTLLQVNRGTAPNFDYPRSYLGGENTWGPYALTVGQWYLLSTVFSNGIVTIYANGDAGISNSVTAEAANGIIVIGCHKLLASNWFDGVYSDLRINNVALSPSVIYQMAHDQRWDLYRPVRQPAAASVGFRRHMSMTGVGVEVG